MSEEGEREQVGRRHAKGSCCAKAFWCFFSGEGVWGMAAWSGDGGCCCQSHQKANRPRGGCHNSLPGKRGASGREEEAPRERSTQSACTRCG